MIVATVCDIPERKEFFCEILKNLLFEQTLPIDRLIVWLNGYHSVPSDFPKDPRVTFFVDPTKPGPWVRYNLDELIYDNDVLLTLDDDLVYPRDYVATGIQWLHQYGERTSLCFAGGFWDSIVPDELLDFYEHRFLIPYTESLTFPMPITMILGGAGIHWGHNARHLVSKELEGFALNDDLMASYNLQQQGIQLLSLPKHQDWISESPAQNASHALWRTDRARRSRTFHQMVQNLGFCPWVVETAEAARCPSVLLLSSVEIPLEQQQTVQRSLPSELQLHTFEIFFEHLKTRPLRDCFEHYSYISSSEGRFGFFPPVRLWRRARVEQKDWRRVSQHLGWIQKELDFRSVILNIPSTGPSWLNRRLLKWAAQFQYSVLS